MTQSIDGWVAIMSGEAATNRNSLNKLKSKNRQEVLEVVRSNGPISIADVAKQTSLSKVTVNKTLDFYTGEGVIAITGKGESTEDGGKRPTLYGFNPDYRTVFCAKIDEVQILAALTNLSGAILASHTIIYDPQTELDDLLLSIQDAFYLLLKRQNRDVSTCIGAAFGWLGVIDPDTGTCFTSPHFSHWGTDIPLLDKLKKLFPPEMDVHVDNWVHFHAYGEVRNMNPRLDKFFVISSEFEGVNGALVVDGKVYRGTGCLAGEIGHMIVDTTDNAEVCLCGGRGCLEAAVSPRRILSQLQNDPKRRKDSVVFKKGRKATLDFANILKAANTNDKVSQAIVDASASYFAVGINNIIQICDPGLIVIQGEYSAGGDYFKKRLLEKVRNMSLLGMNKNIRIEYSILGNEGAILGGSLYIADKFFENPELAITVR